MPTTANIGAAKGKNASGAITKKRFVKLDTAAADGETVKQCDAVGEQAYGVALFSVSVAEIAKGKGCSVITGGRAVVEAGAALPIGTQVSCDASGRAIVAIATHQVLGMVDEPAAGIGNDCTVNIRFGGIF